MKRYVVTVDAGAFTREGILSRIERAKNKLGRNLIILSHFYQNDDIVDHADFVGDSLQLAQTASKQNDAKYIVFCAVSFMAEMARILCRPEQRVFHPEPGARCPLAEMADIDDVEAAWAVLNRLHKKIIPVVYVNSRADLKAFCGKNNGFVCTSANAKKAMEYVFSRDAVPLFFPDENLGRNTAHGIGITDDEMFLWDSGVTLSGTDLERARSAKVLLWKGFCYVHTAFRPSHVEEIRERHGSDMKIIVHPECTPEVVQLSDFVGSTSYIRNTIEKAPSGSQWAIGIEVHFVDRLKRENPDKLIVSLSDQACREMSKVTTLSMLGILEDLVEARTPADVTVDLETSRFARIALDKMLEIS